MPWYNGDFPLSYKNQPVPLREKAVEIANKLLLNGAEEGIAIATGLKRARQYFKDQKNKSGSLKVANASRLASNPKNTDWTE